MTYATVMVTLELDQSNEARLETAGQLAERFDALADCLDGSSGGVGAF